MNTHTHIEQSVDIIEIVKTLTKNSFRMTIKKLGTREKPKSVTIILLCMCVFGYSDKIGGNRSLYCLDFDMDSLIDLDLLSLLHVQGYLLSSDRSPQLHLFPKR